MRKLLPIVVVACGGDASEPARPVVAPPPAPPQHVESLMPPVPTHPWPATRTVDIAETIHDKRINDPYRWLEDENADDVKAWMTAQDEYARGELAKLPHRDELSARIKQLFYFDSISAPVHREGRYFYTRKH